MAVSGNVETSLLEIRSRGGKELLEELADACIDLLGDELARDDLDHQLVVEVVINYRHGNRYRHFFYFKQGRVRGTFVLGPDTAGLYRDYVEMLVDSPLVFVLRVPVRFLAARAQLVITSRPGASFEVIGRLLAPSAREEEPVTGPADEPAGEKPGQVTQVPVVVVSN